MSEAEVSGSEVWLHLYLKQLSNVLFLEDSVVVVVFLSKKMS